MNQQAQDSDHRGSNQLLALRRELDKIEKLKKVYKIDTKSNNNYVNSKAVMSKAAKGHNFKAGKPPVLKAG